MTRKRTIAAGLACSALIVGVAAGAGPASGDPTAGTSQTGRVLFPGNCKTPSFKPKQITLACADSGFVIRSITWSSWTTSSASGKGTARVNDCNPNCAAGTFQSYPASIKLMTPKLCTATRRQFTRIVVTFTGSRPAGFTRTERQHFGCNQD
jgi:hypothetical protein